MMLVGGLGLHFQLYIFGVAFECLKQHDTWAVEALYGG